MGAAQVQCQACSDEEDEMAPQHPPPTTASPFLQGGSGAKDLITTSTTTMISTHAYKLLLLGWIVGADGNDTGIEQGRQPQ
jgi:hypothetical protein